MLLCEPVSTVSLPLPQAVLIVLKETWTYNVNTTPGAEGGGGGGRENASFWRAVALVAKGFWPGL